MNREKYYRSSEEPKVPTDYDEKRELWLTLIQTSGAELGVSGFEGALWNHGRAGFTQEHVAETKARILADLKSAYEYQKETLSDYNPERATSEIQTLTNLYESLVEDITSWEPHYE